METEVAGVGHEKEMMYIARESNATEIWVAEGRTSFTLTRSSGV